MADAQKAEQMKKEEEAKKQKQTDAEAEEDSGDDEVADGAQNGNAPPKKLSKASRRRAKQREAKQKMLEEKTAELALADTVKEDDPTNPYPKVGKMFKRQTWPEPTVPVAAQFPADGFPEGEILNHPLDCNTYRITSEEKRAIERLNMVALNELRHAAEVHRQVRTWVHSWIRPGLPLMTITDRLEAKLEELIVKDGIIRGQAFPTGCSINHIAAHDTPNTGDKRILQENDVLKLDFGTQINGRIIDCAWTVHFNPMFDPLVAAVRAATNEGLKQAGIDVRLGDIGAAIQEVMESYECTFGGRTHKVKSIRNLNGHNIGPYTIHGGKSVPIVKTGDQTKMEEGELYAIETFGSAGGKGYVVEDLECSHYMLTPRHDVVPIRSDSARGLLTHIKKQFNTLAFCRKWLDRQGQTRHILHLNQLCEAGAVERYPPLCDVKGSYTAQSEHTFILRPTCKEILSRGLDY